MNYKSIITKALQDLEKEFSFVDDANEIIDSKIGNIDTNWYPPYLVICDENFYMFLPFSYENFLDEDEIKEECDNSKNLIRNLEKVGVSSKVFFITNSIKGIEALVKQNLTQDFGILHNELTSPFLDFSIKESFGIKCKLLTNVLKYLKNCENLKGKIGDYVRNFSKDYLTKQPEEENEEQIIKKFLKEILLIDDRFELDTTSINFMKDTEEIIRNAGDSIRDHYFHTVNTMLIGFMIIDKFHTKFSTLAKKMGDDIVIEFLWILTSLYHDIGYPVLKYDKILCQISGLQEDDEELISSCKESRREWIESKQYQLGLEALNDLFYHFINKEEDKWIYDGFPHQVERTKFKESVCVSFIDEGAHGAAGSLKLALHMTNIIKFIGKKADREFFYRHIFISTISILFHDILVRNCFKRISIKNIKAELFPFAFLLTYVDIIQNDRRDLTGFSSRPDVFKDVDSSNGKITIELEKEALPESVRKEMLDELEEAFSFFVINGISFGIPKELKNKEK